MVVRRPLPVLGGILGVTLSLAASACSVVDDPGTKSEDTTAPSADATGHGDVVLVTHDSFDLPKKLVKQFDAQTGYHLVHESAGDGGELASKLQLTKGDPLGDVVFGIDNTFASGVLQAGVLAPYDAELPAGAADDLRVPSDDDHELTPIDTGEVCVNVDDAWFAEHHQDPPTGLDDLTDPAYRDEFVTPGATTSSPGMAFLLATIAQYGEDWPEYWKKLMANGAKVDKGWNEAYYTDYTYSGGDRPIVLSYNTDPAYTVKHGRSSTSALLDTCFRQVEYAGVLDGAKNPAGAQAVVDWLLSPQVQAAMPGMYVYPVDPEAKLPADWSKFAPVPDEPLSVSPDDIAANRRKWTTEWTDIISR